MKKIILIVLLLVSYYDNGICQTNRSQIDRLKIERTIIHFLNWYKIESINTIPPTYSLLKGGYPDTTTKRLINMEGVDMYLTHISKTDYFSESYINNLRSYFINIDKGLQIAPKTNGLTPVPGLNTDWILKTFEPEMILNHIKEGRFDTCYIIYNKAIIRFRISKVVQLLFTLTRINNRWFIDYIGYDGTSKYSISRE